MANPEHLKVLKKGVTFWNRWRSANKRVRPDLANARLFNAKLSHINLSDAILSGADLRAADLNFSQLDGATLEDSDLRHAYFWKANLRGAFLGKFDARMAVFVDCDLAHAKLAIGSLIEADFRRAKLNCEILGCVCTQANMRKANLEDASISLSDLSGAFLSNAVIGRTTFADVDLAGAIGLDRVRHSGPSTIGLDTMIRSKGRISKKFLIRTGVPERVINSFASLIDQQFDFHSCFISYSTRDEKFATKLHKDFEEKGISCWKWNHDARTGRSLWGEIGKAVEIHDKVVLIASRASLTSPAVNREIERALDQEDERFKKKAKDRDVLFPIRIDDYILKGWKHERKADVIKKVIADARGWDKNRSIYRRVLDKLLRDLKHEVPKTGL